MFPTRGKWRVSSIPHFSRPENREKAAETQCTVPMNDIFFIRPPSRNETFQRNSNGWNFETEYVIPRGRLDFPSPQFHFRIERCLRARCRDAKTAAIIVLSEQRKLLVMNIPADIKKF